MMDNYSELDLNLIRLFVTIIDTGTLSEAAKRHHITKSHVSKSLKRLEAQLNTQLIRRSTRRLELTQQGEVLYQHGLGILRELEAATNQMLMLGAEPTGTVRLSVPTGLGELILQPILIDFKKAYPRLNLHIMFSNRVNDLIESRVDIALRVVAQPPQDYVAKKVCDVQWRLCASAGYLAAHSTAAQDPQQIAQLQFICSSNRRFHEQIMLENGKTSTRLKLNPGLQSENFRFLLTAAKNDLGVALLPSYVVARDVADGNLQLVLPQYRIAGIDATLYILTTARPHLASAAIKTLTQYLQAQLKTVFSE
ncbi:MAG: LysR family transcriptional regulator [Advenella sp.]